MQTDEATVTETSATDTRHGGGIKKLTFTIGAVIVAGVVGSGVWVLTHSHSNDDHAPRTEQRHSSSTATSETSDSQSTGSQTSETDQASSQSASSATSQSSVAGQQIPVQLTDGSTVTVTADSDTVGHYTDSHGVKHTINFALQKWHITS